MPTSCHPAMRAEIRGKFNKQGEVLHYYLQIRRTSDGRVIRRDELVNTEQTSALKEACRIIGRLSGDIGQPDLSFTR